MNHELPGRPHAGDYGPILRPPARQRIRRSGLWLAIVAGAALYAQAGYAEHFEPPNMEGFNLHSERDADGDGDGVNETHIMQYMNLNGDSMFSMSTQGRIWAWSLDTRDSSIGTSNYVIRDSDCDGTFDEVYGLDEEFHVPACVK